MGLIDATSDTAEVASIIAEVGDARIAALEAELREAHETINSLGSELTEAHEAMHDKGNQLQILVSAVYFADEALRAVRDGDEWSLSVQYALEFMGQMKKEGQ